MALDLTDDTVDVTRPAARRQPAGSPCHHCAVGDHDMCTGVGCYRCPREHHQRKPGISGMGQESVAERRPGGDSTDRKPAHHRGGRR